MARSKSSLTDVSPASAQLKSSFSILERTQLEALKQTSGSFGQGAGKINGSVTNSLQNFSYRDRSKLEIGGLFAEGLEKSGITTKNSGSIISSVVSASIDNRKPFYRNTPTREVDLSIASNRVPDPFQKSPTEKMEEKRVSLVGEKDFITFPPDLTERAHAYLGLHFYRYTRGTPFEAGAIEDGGHIYLPIPEDFTQDFFVQYGEQDAGIFAAGLTATETGRTMLRNFSNYLEGVEGSSLSSIATGVDFRQAMTDAGQVSAYAGFGALNSVSPVIGGLVGKSMGAIANPHPSIFFQGVNLREYTFTWKLIPRSKTEADTIKAILKKIRKECLPKKSGNYLTYPSLVEPKIEKGTFGQDQFYKKSFVKSISINYNGEGTSAFFVDGNPVSIILSLGLQEAELYLEDAPESTASEGGA